MLPIATIITTNHSTVSFLLLIKIQNYKQLDTCLKSGEIIHCVMNIVQNPQQFRTELRYKRQLCGESCGPGLVSMSPVSRKIFGAHVLLSGGVVSGHTYC